MSTRKLIIDRAHRVEIPMTLYDAMKADGERLDYLAKYYGENESVPCTREKLDEEMAAQAEQDAEACGAKIGCLTGLHCP